MMPASEGARRKEIHTQAKERLTRNQRRVLGALCKHSTPIDEKRLAEILTESTAANRSVAAMHTQIHHLDLPKLAEAGFIDLDRDANRVTDIDATAVDNADFESALDPESRADEIAEGSLTEDQLAIMYCLESREGAIDRTTLGREVLTQDGDSEPSVAEMKKLKSSLHHLHLPKLEEAGLVEYDTAAGEVSATSAMVPDNTESR